MGGPEEAAKAPTIKETAEAVEGAAKALGVPRIMKDAAPAIGRVIATSADLIHIPLEMMQYGAEKARAWLTPELDKRLKGVPLEQLKLADPHIVAPAVQGLIQAFEHQELRDAFANLIAAAVNKGTAEEVLPCFATTLKELASDEAKILRWSFHSGEDIGVVNVHSMIRRIPPSHNLIATNFSTVGQKAGCTSRKMVPVYLDHLSSLELYDLLPVNEFKEEPALNGIGELPEFREAWKKAEAAGKFVETSSNLMRLSGLGRAFCKVCIGPAPV